MATSVGRGVIADGGMRGMRMKRFVVRAFVTLLLLAILANVAGLLARRFFTHDADEADDEFDILTIMNGLEFNSRAEALRAGTVRTIFGGTELDLRGAEMAPEGAYLEVSTTFAGTQIVVPEDWRVDVIGTPAAGGHEVNVADSATLPLDAPHLVIDARTVLGGLEVVAREAEVEEAPAFGSAT